MAGYSIYFPGVQGSSPQHFDRVGLVGLAENAQFCDVLQHGPDGGRGVVATWPTGKTATDSHPGMHEAIRWVAAKPDEERKLAAGRFWMGFDEARPLTPVDVARKAQAEGCWRVLRDGQAWKIPSCPRLPSRATLHPGTGKFCFATEPRYAEFARRANTYAVEMFKQFGELDLLRSVKPDIEADATVGLEIEEAWQHCCDALSINYRLTPELIDAMELLDQTTMVAVVLSTFDYDQIIECAELKKKPTATISLPVSGAA